MAEVTSEELAQCVQIVGGMWETEVADRGHEREAEHAAAMLLSGSGLLYAVPEELLDVLDRAIEIGYMAALQDVQKGEHDDNIRSWRPDLGYD